MDRALYDAYYASLPLRPGQMRLVHIARAATWDEPVQCEIAVVDIVQSPAPAYNAISYTWGGQAAEHAVTCNGRPILVTQSCVDALKGVRFQELPVVWIDQLCINQFDLRERNEQ